MSTVIRPVVSEKNRYRIPKHRYYELKHFCLQYNDWKQRYVELISTIGAESIKYNPALSANRIFVDRTADTAIELESLSRRITMVEEIVQMADKCLAKYILKSVTEDVAFPKLSAYYEIPCGKDMFYDRRRKFFWLLHRARD